MVYTTLLPGALRSGVLLTTTVWAFQPLLAIADDTRMVHRELISSIGSERATSGNGNKITTVDGKTPFVWQDANNEGYFARVRTLEHKTSQWSPVHTLGEGRDNHARPTITVDSKGYLHVGNIDRYRKPSNSAGRVWRPSAATCR